MEGRKHARSKGHGTTLVGTFVSVCLLGAVLAAAWFGVFGLFLARQ